MLRHVGIGLIVFASAACGADNGESCDIGDDCASEYCVVADRATHEGVCQDPPAACDDDITCDCQAIGDACPRGSHTCFSQTKSGVTISCSSTS